MIESRARHAPFKARLRLELCSPAPLAATFKGFRIILLARLGYRSLSSLSSTQWHLDRLLEIFCARDLHVFWPLKILDGSHRTELHRQPSLRTPPALCSFAPVGHCDSSCCSASRPIPSPSFNTEAAEPTKAPSISPLRSSEEFDDTYLPVTKCDSPQGLSDFPEDRSFMK